jgi:hypothetical protein
MLYQLVKSIKNLEGDMAEVGVYKGGTAKLIAKAEPTKTVHLFDTFSGMPDRCLSIDLHHAGEFNDCSLSQVKSFLQDCANVFFYPGVFPETGNEVLEKKFSLVHIDTDIYLSVKACLEFFYPRLSSSGALIIDDYESAACPGVKQAVVEYMAEKSEYPIITAEAQCVIIKR